jgi:hypothetical protein
MAILLIVGTGRIGPCGVTCPCSGHLLAPHGYRPESEGRA